MLKRIITAAVALALLIPILIFGQDIGAVCVFTLICGFGAFEMLGCCGIRKDLWVSLPSVAVCAFAALLPLLQSRGTVREGLFGYAAIASATLVYYMFVGVIRHKTLDIERLMMSFAVLFYVAAGFCSLSLISVSWAGLSGIALVLAVSWGTDTFAYFTGMAFGKKKLCPEISPKKTVAGALGGTLFGTLAGVITMWLAFGQPLLGLIGLPLSVISQLGDLAASVIKRRFGVKDYGKIFPGHGGVLDRFDSIIPTAILTQLILPFIV